MSLSSRNNHITLPPLLLVSIAMLGLTGCAAPKVPQRQLSPAEVQAQMCQREFDAGSTPVDTAMQERFMRDMNDTTAGSREFQKLARPPRVLVAVPPSYPVWAKRCGVEGRVLLLLVVGEDGRVVRTNSLGNPPPVLADAAQAAVGQWRFEPQTVDGRPKAVMFMQPVNFVLSSPPINGQSVVVGLPELAPEDARKRHELALLSARIESNLGPGTRYITTLTTEAPLVEYASRYSARVREIAASGGPNSTPVNRITVTLDGAGHQVAVMHLDETDATERARREQVLSRAATLGPLPTVAGGTINRIAVTLPFEAPPRGAEGPTTRPSDVGRR